MFTTGVFSSTADSAGREIDALTERQRNIHAERKLRQRGRRRSYSPKMNSSVSGAVVVVFLLLLLLADEIRSITRAGSLVLHFVLYPMGRQTIRAVERTHMTAQAHLC